MLFGVVFTPKTALMTVMLLWCTTKTAEFQKTRGTMQLSGPDNIYNGVEISAPAYAECLTQKGHDARTTHARTTHDALTDKSAYP